MFDVHLKRLYSATVVWNVLYICARSDGLVLFKSSVPVLNLLDLPLSLCTVVSISFCFIYFEALLLGT